MPADVGSHRWQSCFGWWATSTETRDIAVQRPFCWSFPGLLRCCSMATLLCGSFSRLTVGTARPVTAPAPAPGIHLCSSFTGQRLQGEAFAYHCLLLRCPCGLQVQLTGTSSVVHLYAVQACSLLQPLGQGARLSRLVSSWMLHRIPSRGSAQQKGDECTTSSISRQLPHVSRR